MGSLVLAGATSGSTTITPSATGTYTITLPAETGTIQTSGSGFTTNGVAYASSTSALATGSSLVFSSGNLGIGTSSPTGLLSVASTSVVANPTAWGAGYSVFGPNAGSASGAALGLSYYTASDQAQITALAPGIAWKPLVLASGGLIFQTSNGSDAGRFDSSGNLLVGTTSVDGAGSKVQLSSSGNRVFTMQNTANVNGDQLLWLKLGSNCNTSASPVFICDTGGTNRLVIYGNGNVQNTNNSYGALSDIKLKENIVDATPKLEDLLKVKVRNYNLKTDPEHKQLGVVAQELETVFPSMIEESPDRDAEGNVLETTTKSVKYSVFVPMLVKAIQELNTLITAQSATITSLTERITALEGK
jgi:hypothetical protein